MTNRSIAKKCRITTGNWKVTWSNSQAIDSKLINEHKTIERSCDVIFSFAEQRASSTTNFAKPLTSPRNPLQLRLRGVQRSLQLSRAFNKGHVCKTMVDGCRERCDDKQQNSGCRCFCPRNSQQTSEP